MFVHGNFKIKFMNKAGFITIILLFVFFQLRAQDEGWEYLFNGKDLSGWTQLNGEAKFEAINGEIVGTTVANTPNSFLVTDKTYGDFVFEVELLVEDDMNSGIQFRSESKAGYMDGRVHGYQCEVDPSDRAWSGGIYDEARRGWLYPVELNPEAYSAFKHGEWNHYRIECIGPSIRTWLNGVAVAYINDDMTPEGFFALQVHSIPDDSLAGKKIRWKNIRIKTQNLKPAPFEDIYIVNLLPNNLCDGEKQQGYRLLFDGKSVNLWKGVNSEEFPSVGWGVENGNLTVYANNGDLSKKGGDIITRQEFGPFELKFEFNITEGANSGVKYGIGNNGPALGLEYQILDDKNHPDANGGVVGNRKLGSLYDLIPSETESRYVKGPGEWNRGRIVTYPDNRVEHWLNGRKVVEYTRGGKIYKALIARSKYARYEKFGLAEKGPVLLQDHNDTVRFRSIKIREM